MGISKNFPLQHNKQLVTVDYCISGSNSICKSNYMNHIYIIYKILFFVNIFLKKKAVNVTELTALKRFHLLIWN